MKKLYGIYEIAKYLGWEKDYMRLGVVIAICNAPKTLSQNPNSKGINVYCITEGQAEALKVMIESMRKVLNISEGGETI